MVRLSATVLSFRHAMHGASHVKRGSTGERIIRILHSGKKSRNELIKMLGLGSRLAGREINRLVRRKILLESEEEGRKFYSLTQLGIYIHLCLELDIGFVMLKILALAYHNFDISARNNSSVNFPVTKPEVEEKVSVMGYLYSKKSAWVMARQLASKGYGYVRNGCFVLYPHVYLNLRAHDSVLQSLYFMLCEMPGRVMVLLLREEKFRERVERFANVIVY